MLGRNYKFAPSELQMLPANESEATKVLCEVSFPVPKRNTGQFFVRNLAPPLGKTPEDQQPYSAVRNFVQLLGGTPASFM